MPTLLQLRHRQCRYPLTQESPWLFCARATADGRSYCERHHAICTKGPPRSVDYLVAQIHHADKMSIPTEHKHWKDDIYRPIDEVLRG